MQNRVRAALGVSVALALAALAAAAAPAATQKVLVLQTPNRTDTNRTARQIDTIVVHVTQGPYRQSIKWLRSPRGGGSSHFIVSRRGAVAQLVSTSDIAWHAGNKRVNARSIGIEHTGFVGRTFPEVEYRASARLAAYLANRFDIPIDREHFIGHDEVPDPANPGRVGGIDHHTDPGPNWDWDLYLSLVRAYADDPPSFAFVAPKPKPGALAQAVEGGASAAASRKGAKEQAEPLRPPAVVVPGGPKAPAGPAERAPRCGYRVSVHSTTIADGATIAGQLPWSAAGCGRIHRIDFFVDGKLRWVDRTAPFAYARGRGLDSTTLQNGWHTLSVRGYGRNGHRVRKRTRVRVENVLYRVTATGVARGQAVEGVVRIAGKPTAPTRRVSLFIDGKVVARDRTAPYAFEVETRRLDPGPHRLDLVADARDGRQASVSVPVLVTNGDAAVSVPHVTWQSLADWQPVAGPVAWRALVDGDVQQVEFWVDGVLRWVDREAPYAYGGPGGVWDSGTVAPGPHRLTVRAVGLGGGVTESPVTVLAAPAG